MNCGHKACAPCLDLYFVHLNEKRTCPTCREEVTQCKDEGGLVRGFPDPAPPCYVGRHAQKKPLLMTLPVIMTSPKMPTHSTQSPETGMYTRVRFWCACGPCLLHTGNRHIILTHVHTSIMHTYYSAIATAATCSQSSRNDFGMRTCSTGNHVRCQAQGL